MKREGTGRALALDFMQLRCFVAVAEELHFARAAARLNMTQPPLSRHVQALERVLGVALLARTSRSVRLTAAGRGFLPDARRILRLAQDAAETARQLATGRTGTLRLAFTAAAAYDVLPRLLSACRERLPGLGLDLREMVTRQQTEALLARTCDLSLLRPPVRSRDLASLRVAAEPLVLAVPAGHRLAGSHPIGVAALEGEPLIGYHPVDARYFHDLVARVLDRAGVAPAPVQTVGQIHSMLALVRSGLGIALVPDGARSLRPEGVAFRALQPDTSDRSELSLAWRRDSDHPALPEVLALARAILPPP